MYFLSRLTIVNKHKNKVRENFDSSLEVRYIITHEFNIKRTPVVLERTREKIFKKYNYKEPELFITNVLNTTGRQLH